MSDPRFEGDTPFTEADIGEIEKALGRNLPKDYSDFAKAYGGAFVGGMIDGSDEFPILCFFGTDRDNGILSMLAIHSDFRDEGALPIGRCQLGNLYVLDRDNTVHYINYYGGNVTARKVADSFGDFITRIVVQEE